MFNLIFILFFFRNSHLSVMF